MQHICNLCKKVCDTYMQLSCIYDPYMLSGGFRLHICLINVSSYMQVAHIYEFKIRIYAVISAT